MNKNEVYEKCGQLLREKIAICKAAMDGAQDGANSEGRSTAGDKHDTARAMSHINRDMYAKQLSELLKQQKNFASLAPGQGRSEKVEAGSIVNTKLGWIYISISLGALDVAGTKVMAVSPLAPLAQVLLGKKKGDTADFRGQRIVVEDLR